MRWVLVLSFLFAGAARAEETWWRVFGEVEVGSYRGGHFDEEEGKPLTDEHKALLKTRKFEEWETYEDECVRFRYPKHPLLKLQVNEGDGGITVEGGVCTTVDNSFNRAYVLKVGSATYGVFLLSPAEWLDDGI